jgi:hypothetical protein
VKWLIPIAITAKKNPMAALLAVIFIAVLIGIMRVYDGMEGKFWSKGKTAYTTIAISVIAVCIAGGCTYMVYLLF